MTFPESIFPQRFTVAGVALQPFCVGHAVLLERLNSPILAAAIVSDDAANDIEIGPGDIAQFLWVCSRPPGVAWAGLHPMTLKAKWFLHRHGRRVRRGTALVALLARAYIQRQYQGPEIKGCDSKGLHIPSMPVMAGILAACMADLAMRRDDALHTPVGEALWLIGVSAARNGVVELKWADQKTMMAARLLEAAEGGANG